MKKLYIFWPDDWRDGSYYLVNDEWFCMASHYCSNYWYAKWDLIENRPERLEKWKDYLANWYSIEIADESTEEILWDLNKKFADAEYRNKYAKENNL